MAALQCEICGGKLIGKPGGIFECDSCGMEYSTEWAKAKIQEIKGTVKVEGTVEVTGKVQVDGGTVKVEGGVNIESLLKRGQMELNSEHWDKAAVHFDNALNLNAECAEAYLGMLLASRQRKNIDDLVQMSVNYEQDDNFLNAVRFADGNLKLQLDIAIQSVKQKTEKWKSAAKRRNNAAREIMKAGSKHTVGLNTNGTVVATGHNKFCSCDVSGWAGVASVEVDGYRTFGLTEDGSLLRTGLGQTAHLKKIVSIAPHMDVVFALLSDGRVRKASDGLGDYPGVEDWRDIIAISAGSSHLVGLKADGTVVAAGSDKYGNQHGQCNVSSWRNIVAIAADNSTTIGLKGNGTVVATGYNNFGQCNVSKWKDIIEIAFDGFVTAGLKSDGTVVATEKGDHGECSITDWRDIVSITADSGRIMGLRCDGTVVARGSNDKGQCNVTDWRDIIAVSVGEKHTVGLRVDGTLVATGDNDEGQCNVAGWKLFDDIEQLEQKYTKKAELIEASRAEMRRMRIARIEQRRKELEKNKIAAESELANLNGFFSGRRRKELETELVEIETELKGLC